MFVESLIQHRRSCCFFCPRIPIHRLSIMKSNRQSAISKDCVFGRLVLGYHGPRKCLGIVEPELVVFPQVNATRRGTRDTFAGACNELDARAGEPFWARDELLGEVTEENKWGGHERQNDSTDLDGSGMIPDKNCIWSKIARSRGAIKSSRTGRNGSWCGKRVPGRQCKSNSRHLSATGLYSLESR